MWLTLRNKNLFSSSHFYKINLPLGSSYPKTPGDQKIGYQKWAKSDWATLGRQARENRRVLNSANSDRTLASNKI